LRSLTEDQGDHAVSSTAVERLTELTMGLALGFMLEDTGLLIREGDDAPGKTAYESVAWQETVAQLRLELADLPEREQTILRQHYIDGVGFDELASLLKMTRSRISQLHRSALIVLRKRMRSRNHFRVVR
jgi:RNA polymerase sigma factor for flagellar operon FliA